MNDVLKHVRRIEMVSLELPNTVFPVKASNGTLYLSITYAGTTNVYTLTLPPGIYDTTTLPETCNELLAQAFHPVTGTSLASVTFVYSPLTDKLVIEHLADALLSVKVVSQGGVAPPAWSGYKGDSRDAYSPLVDLNTNNPMFVPFESINLTTPTVAFLRISCLNSQSDVPMTSDSINVQNIKFPKYLNSHLNNIVARVQLSSPSMSLVFNQYHSYDTFFYFQIPESYPAWTLERMQVEWLDELGNLIDFNGVEHSFMLRVMWHPPLSRQ
jgi:hypothetical protein